MMGNYKIFVEGEADKRFIEQLVQHLWNASPEEISVIVTNGYANMMAHGTESAYINQMRRTTDDGGVNLVIFDADIDCESRRQEIIDWGSKNGVSFELFLLPDNFGNGALEDLLERIINPSNRVVMDCWDSYENAIRKILLPWKNGEPLTIPAKKTKIYAYLEVLLGASKTEKKKIKEKERNYLDKNHWDLDAMALSELVRFLRDNIKF